MTARREHPRLLEVNARLWLARLAARDGAPYTLATIPDADLDAIGGRYDLLWVMGVWRRSPGARARALTTPENRAAYDAALPGWGDADVDGSPYAIHAYEPDARLGAPGDLRALRARLHHRGVGLIVDFVANHLALDHPWTTAHPDRFVRVTDATGAGHPEQFVQTAEGVWLAHGRDPYFPPWSDTVQLNPTEPDTRRALRDQLLAVADDADGVRCDMAMLGLSEVFERGWGWTLPPDRSPHPELWAELIAPVKTRHPRFLFLAEAYWGLESQLLDLGFDYAYDKTFYDLLRGGDAGGIRRHLASPAPPVGRGLRFVENHDEARAPAAFGRERSQGAAVAALTLPGVRLVHDGQVEGRTVRVPVQLGREPDEPVDEPMRRFYTRLLETTGVPAFHDGVWRLLEARPLSAGDDSPDRVVVWGWRHATGDHLTVLNQSDRPARVRVEAPEPGAWVAARWTDALEPTRPVEGGDPEGRPGVDLDPWSARLIRS